MIPTAHQVSPYHVMYSGIRPRESFQGGVVRAPDSVPLTCVCSDLCSNPFAYVYLISYAAHDIYTDIAE